MREVKLFWCRFFCVITKKEAEKLGLKHLRNVYGDEINALDCRSIWKDKKGRTYRIHELIQPNK